MRDERGRSFLVHSDIKLARSEQRMFPRSAGSMFYVLTLYAVSFLVLFALFASPPAGEIGLFLWLALIGTGLVAVTVMLAIGSWIANREVYERVARSMRHGSNCPQCWYDLAGHGHEQDGCVVCPECGAAWRLGSVDER